MSNPEPQHSGQSSVLARVDARVGVHSDQGKVRDYNEDRVAVFDLRRRQPLSAEREIGVELQTPGLLLVVADGMGGMAAGEQASQMCVDSLPAELMKRFEQRPPATRDDLRGALAEAVRETHKSIYERAASKEDLRGMGTTLTAALVEESFALIAQVGDSRAYLGRGGQVTQLTRDQTVWESLRAEGKDPEKELGKGSFKNMLLQALGAQPEVQVAVSEHELHAEDWLVLCTDGLYRVVTPEGIGEVLRAGTHADEKARQLTARANEGGGPDNVSVIVCQVGSGLGRESGVSVGRGA